MATSDWHKTKKNQNQILQDLSTLSEYNTKQVKNNCLVASKTAKQLKTQVLRNVGNISLPHVLK